MDIRRIVGKSEEFGFAFLEQITYYRDFGGGAECVCEDMYPDADTIELKDDDTDDLSDSNEKESK